MTTHTTTFPVPDYHGPIGRVAQLGASVLLAAALVAAARAVTSGPGGPSGTAAPRFAPAAFGTLAGAAELVDRPTGGRALATLAGGTAIEIGGRVDVPLGLVTARALWVRVAAGAGEPRLGFVAAEDVIVTAGHVAPLDLTVAPPEAWLAAGGGEVEGDDAVGASAAPASGALDAAVALGISSAPPARTALPAWLPPTVARWQPQIAAAAAAQGVDPALVALVVLVASGGEPSTVGAAGATGLMGVMPGTAAARAAAAGVDLGDGTPLADVERNLALGTAQLAALLGEFGRADDPDWQGSVERAAAAYVGGATALGQHLTTGGPLPPDAAAFQRWIGGMWRERGAATSPTMDEWLASGGAGLLAAAGADSAS